MLKTCSKCRLEKPYFPEEKKNSKASGFNGKTCWDCFLARAFERSRKIRSTAEGRQKANVSAALSSRRLVTDPATGNAISAGALATRKIRSTEEGRKKTNAATVKRLTERLKTDAWYRLRRQLGQETSRLLKQIGKGKGKDETIVAHFGATREEVYTYIDIQLRERGFSWENHGWQWVGDHRKPLALAQDSNELLRLCHLPNLQVLTPAENRKKGIEDIKLIRQHEARQV